MNEESLLCVILAVSAFILAYVRPLWWASESCRACSVSLDTIKGVWNFESFFVVRYFSDTNLNWFDFWIVSRVCHGLPLGCHPASRHPLGVLRFWIASEPHLCHAFGRGDLQLDLVLPLWQVDVGGHLTTLQVHLEIWRGKELRIYKRASGSF